MNSITTTRMSQTWFASQIGAIASAISARWRSRRPTASEQVPDAAAEVGATRERIDVEGSRDRPGDKLGQGEVVRQPAHAALLPVDDATAGHSRTRSDDQRQTSHDRAEPE